MWSLYEGREKERAAVRVFVFFLIKLGWYLFIEADRFSLILPIKPGKCASEVQDEN